MDLLQRCQVEVPVGLEVARRDVAMVSAENGLGPKGGLQWEHLGWRDFHPSGLQPLLVLGRLFLELLHALRNLVVLLGVLPIVLDLRPWFHGQEDLLH